MLACSLRYHPKFVEFMGYIFHNLMLKLSINGAFTTRTGILPASVVILNLNIDTTVELKASELL